jgi:ATP-dependent Lon protease
MPTAARYLLFLNFYLILQYMAVDFLALFPLQLVVFPGENFNLHIFEPRYKQLIRECHENGVSFGIPSYINKRINDIGTEMILLKVEKQYEDGKMDIKARGIGTFKIEKFYNPTFGKLYPGADIQRIEQQDKGEIYKYMKIYECMEEFYGLMQIQKKLPSGPSEFNIFQIAHHIGLSVEKEYKILSASNEHERQDLVLEHFAEILPFAREVEALKEKAKLNGQYKNIIPPAF